MKLSDFQFDLPKTLLAQRPSPDRDESRLMVLNRKEEKIEHVKDLQADPILVWQDKHIFKIGAFAGIIFPGLIGLLIIGGFSGFLGGLIWGGLVRLVIVHHGTFLINSGAHYWGKQNYSTKNTSRDSPILSLLTFGEGYHNFHHTFQSDYRNGHRWYHWDPTKWWIKIFSFIKITNNLLSLSRPVKTFIAISIDFSCCIFSFVCTL